jgi:uncharacterized membrane protein
MALYELLLFVHITAAVIWVGSGFLIQVQGVRATRQNDPGNMKRVLDDAAGLSTIVFIPASLVVVVFGVSMVIESDAWSFDQLWLVLGLIGYFATFVTGVAVLKPRSEYLVEAIAREGVSDHVMMKIRELLLLTRIDFVVLVLVVFDMAVKPTGDDPGVLVAMALVLAAGIGLCVTQARGLTPSAGAEASPASAAP